MGAEPSKSKSRRSSSSNGQQRTQQRMQQPTFHSKMLDCLKTDSRVQLISRSSGHALQVLSGPDESLILNGLGGVGVHFNHAIWTVQAYSYGVVSLHNQYNYLAVENGKTILKHYAPGERPGKETIFNCYTESYFGIDSLWLESAVEKCFVGVLSDGNLNEAFWTGKDRVGEFSLKVLYTSRDRSHTLNSLPEDMRISSAVSTAPPVSNGVKKRSKRPSKSKGSEPRVSADPPTPTIEAVNGNGLSKGERAFSSSMQTYNSPNEAYGLLEKEAKEGRYKKNPRMTTGPFQPVVTNTAPQDDLADLEEDVFERKDETLADGVACIAFGNE